VVRRSILPAAAAVCAVAALAWWAAGPSGGRRVALEASTPVAGAASAIGPAALPAPADVATLAGAAPARLEAAPPGLSDAQWATVEAGLRGRPDAALERARLIDYFGWQDAARRWRAKPTDPALAAAVQAGLPERLARREVSAAEARQLEATLLATLEPDPTRREAALKAFDAARPEPVPPDARTVAFQRAQAAAVAAWTAVPAAQRDPAALKSELERLRRQHFAQAPTSTPQEASR
jgi:hypothetical protein